MSDSTWRESLSRFGKRIWRTCVGGGGIGGKRKMDVHAVTQRGKLHTADEIPNQDKSFGFVRAGKRSGRGNVAATGVFDGHGMEGHFASQLACERMERGIETMLGDTSGQETGLVEVLESIFKETAIAVNSSACGSGSGTTASVVSVRENEAAVAWVGDSVVAIIADAVPSSPAHIRFASTMHRVADPSEADRVIKAGGKVQDGYVVNSAGRSGIAVTRTLGDVDMHQYGCISVPQTARLKLQKRDAVIVIATDGLWDTKGLTADAVLRIASRRRGRTAKRICQSLMGLVEREGGPSDDCTIVSVTLR